MAPGRTPRPCAAAQWPPGHDVDRLGLSAVIVDTLAALGRARAQGEGRWRAA